MRAAAPARAGAASRAAGALLFLAVSVTATRWSAPLSAHPVAPLAVRELEAIRLAVDDHVRRSAGAAPSNWRAIWRAADVRWFLRRAPGRPPLHDAYRFVRPRDRAALRAVAALADVRALLVSRTAISFAHGRAQGGHAHARDGGALTRWGVVGLDARGRAVVRWVPATDATGARLLASLRLLRPDLDRRQRAALRRMDR